MNQTAYRETARHPPRAAGGWGHLASYGSGGRNLRRPRRPGHRPSVGSAGRHSRCPGRWHAV